MDDLLTQLARRPRPLRVGVVGAGKFATMFTTQARRIEGLSAGATVIRPVAAGKTIGLDAVEVREDEIVARLRRESLEGGAGL